MNIQEGSKPKNS